MGVVINVKDEYFNWLVHYFDGSDYYNLLKLMDDTTFVVYNPMDENRVSDVDELRQRWIDECGKWKDERIRLEVAEELLSKPVSLFEVLCELCIKTEDTIFYEPDKIGIYKKLFWEFMNNLIKSGLFGTRYTTCHQAVRDERWGGFEEQTMKKIFTMVVERKYQPNGKGGFFPCKNSDVNQRKVEMWVACVAYLNENYKF